MNDIVFFEYDSTARDEPMLHNEVTWKAKTNKKPTTPELNCLKAKSL